MRNDRSTAGPGPSEKPAEEEKSDLVALGCVWASVFPALPAAGPLSHPGWDPEGELLLLRLHVASSVRVLILIQPPPPLAPEDRGTFMIDVYIQRFSLNVNE